MAEFTFFWPTKMLFGRGKIKEAGEEAGKLGKRALLAIGRGSVKKTGTLDRVAANLESSGVEVILFEGIEPNPKSDVIDEAGELARKKECEFVIGLGGGSVMDAAKGIAVSATHQGSIWEYMNSFEVFKEVSGAALPVMEIPTVAGTGSEGNLTAVISNRETHEKAFIKNEVLFPRVSIIDPELTVSLPPRITAECGVDIVCHVLEPYLTAGIEFAASSRVLEAIMKVVVENLFTAVWDGSNYNARENLSWASTLGCSPFRGLGLSGGGPLHHIEHALSGWFDISHGGGLCALLPSWLEYTSDSISGRLEEFGQEVFGEKDALSAVRKWLNETGVDMKLGELGVDKKACRQMALDTVKGYGKGKDFIAGGPKKLFAEDIIKIYENAF